MRILERSDERPMRRLRDVLADMSGSATPEEHRILADVQALAIEFVGLAPLSRPGFLAEVRKLTTGHERNIAVRLTPPEHHTFPPLMELIDALIASDPNLIVTPHGVFTRDDLHTCGARTKGHDLIQFPIRWPWRSPPDDKRGIAGVRGDPIYRREEERGPHVESFRVVHQDTTPERQPWIEDAS